MFNKLFSEITATDIQTLINSGISENTNLEFKREVWGKLDEDRKEMLRDISSMANAYGGYFVIGMEEDQAGEAKEIIDIPNVESERDSLLASLMANLHPRIIGLDINVIKFEDGKKILLIRVPDGFNLHQVTFKGMYQFWKRHDRQKSRMTYDEIKDSIIKNHVGSGQSIELLEKRKQLHDKSKKVILMLTAQPIKAESELFKTSNTKLRDLLKSSGGRRAGWDFDISTSYPRPTLNGISIANENRAVNFYRNGYVEATVDIGFDEGYVFNSEQLTINEHQANYPVLRREALIEFTFRFVRKVELMLKEIGYDAPMSFSLNLLNIKGFALRGGNERSSQYHSPFLYSESSIEVEPLTYEFIDATTITKDLCDRVFQAYGFEETPYYENGRFTFFT